MLQPSHALHSNLTCSNPRNVTVNGNITTFYDDCKAATRVTIPLKAVGSGYQTLSLKAHRLHVNPNVSFSATLFAPIVITGANPDNSYLNHKWGHGPPTYLVTKVSPGLWVCIISISCSHCQYLASTDPSTPQLRFPGATILPRSTPPASHTPAHLSQCLPTRRCRSEAWHFKTHSKMGAWTRPAGC